jgi:hypothetical protein
MQQLILSPPRAPSRVAPTWADIARGVTCTQREAPSITPVDIIAIYQCCAAEGVQARFSVINLAGFEEVCLTCRFIDTATPHAHPARRCQRQRRRHRRKPASSSTSSQTELIKAMPTSRLHSLASPTSLARTTSPTAPPPAKKTQKRRC